jgi:hypothetical protein
MHFLSTIAFHRDNPIYQKDLKAYASDSHRALASRGKPRRNLIKGYLHQIFGRLTLPNSSVSVALVAATLLASHCVYA